jgi:hypothetical protein
MNNDHKSTTETKTQTNVESRPTTDERIILNVGGIRYETWLSTILKYSDTLLARMFCDQNRKLLVKDQNGEYFIDRNGKYFEPILDFYRTGELLIPSHLNPEIVQKEIDYFQLQVQVSSFIT